MGIATREWTKDLLSKVLKTKKDSLTPRGTIISFMGKIAPEGYFICNGAEYNISDYPEFAQYLKDQFGKVNYFGGDGTSTFAVPDLRGEFLRGSGTASRGTGTGANVGVHQDGTKMPYIFASKINENGTIGYRYDKNNTEDYYMSSDVDLNIKTSNGQNCGFRYVSNMTEGVSSVANLYHTSRPTNTSVLYCIKY